MPSFDTHPDRVTRPHPVHRSQAGDAPWHFAEAMGQTDVMRLLEREGASKDMGPIIVPEHVDKIKVRSPARRGRPGCVFAPAASFT